MYRSAGPEMRTAQTDIAQRDVVEFLSTPAAYGLPADTPIERVDTHISIVFLAGQRAYKLKRSVTFDYVDFSALELRHAACEAELRLNRRTAPTLYLDVCAVTRESNGELALAGIGEPVDWVVVMVRFEQDALFDRIAGAGQLDLSLMDDVADAIARLHTMAEKRIDRGGREGMAWVVDGNALAFQDLFTDERSRAIAHRVSSSARAQLDRHGDLLDSRRQAGFVRECHGDLHLRNICLLDGVPTIFDAVEFNDQISCIDVLYDLAFLLMDLWRRRLRVHANAVFNGYLARTVDLDGLPLLPLFLSCRAAIRAKTSAAGARVQADGRRSGEMKSAAHDYLRLAESLLGSAPARLISIGGYSGSGKSTLARELAPIVGAPPGALILRSDIVRKLELGVDPLTALGAEAYTSSMNERVYRIIAERATSALSAGQAVIADAVYANAGGRMEIEAVARDVGVAFLGFWLDAPRALLSSRLTARTSDASDATVDVLESQMRSGEVPVEWHHLDASQKPEVVRQRAETIIDQRIG